MVVERNTRIAMARENFKFLVILAAICTSGLTLKAQTAASQQPSAMLPVIITEGAGNLEISQDPRLDVVMNKRIEFNRKLALSPQGFRIVLYSGRVRQDAYAIQEKFKRAYPDQEAYLTFAFPNFKINAGDYKSREQALQMLSALKDLFADQSLLIVPQKIDLLKAYEPDVQ